MYGRLNSIRMGGRLLSSNRIPYLNTCTLDKLTLETFNAMLNGTVYLPSYVLIDKNNIASVSAFKNDGYIEVLWSSCAIDNKKY